VPADGARTARFDCVSCTGGVGYSTRTADRSDRLGTRLGALFENDDELVGEPRLVTLAAWALVERGDGQTQLVGLVQKPRGEDTPDGWGPAREAADSRCCRE